MKFTVVMLVLSVGWWSAYVTPHDNHMNAVAQCVLDQGQELTDQAAWAACNADLMPKAKGLVPYLN